MGRQFIPAHIVSALVSSSHFAIAFVVVVVVGSVLAFLIALLAVVRWLDRIARMFIILRIFRIVCILLSCRHYYLFSCCFLSLMLSISGSVLVPTVAC